jgi:hypothetical protein
MRKGIIVLSILLLGIVIFLSGCTENDGGLTEPKTVTMIAQEFGDDMQFEMSGTTMKTYYNSLNDGDTLIFQDTIDKISYDETTEITTIEFEYSQDDGDGTYTSKAQFIFEGDLTGDYSIGDEVQITVTIKRVTITMEGMTLDMELYEEYWISEEHFIENYMTGVPFKPLSATKITKV